MTMISRCYLEITNVCNLDCVFCPKTDRPKHRLTQEEFDHLTDKLQGQVQFLYFHLMGEPFLHPLLPDFIQSARQKGFVPVLTTNGTLLPKTRGVIEAHPHKIQISLHSQEGNGKENPEAYLEGVMKFALEAASAGIIIVLRLWNQGFDEGRNLKTEALIRERFPNEWKWGRKGARIRDKLHLEYDTRFAWPDMEADDMGSGVFCYGLKDHFGILCDGRVIPCCLDREGAVTLGNIFEENSIEEILSSPRAVAMRKGFTERRATEELCRKCGYARRF